MLQEILKEQKETHRLHNQLVSKIESLAHVLENFETEFNTTRNVDVIDDSKALEIIMERIENIKQIVAHTMLRGRLRQYNRCCLSQGYSDENKKGRND